MQSVETNLFNFTDRLGFFTGTSGSYSAITNSAYTVTSNYLIDYTGCSSGYNVNLIYDLFTTYSSIVCTKLYIFKINN